MVEQTNGGDSPLEITYKKGSRYIHVTIVFNMDDHQVTVECRELGTGSFGSTLEEAEEAIIEAVALHLNTLDDEGELEPFCREHEIPIYSDTPPRWVPSVRGQLVSAEA